MADYICTYRTNYFRVTDEEKYQKLINKLAGEDLEIFDDENSNGMDTFYKELQQILPNGEAMILQEAGHEKLNYGGRNCNDHHQQRDSIPGFIQTCGKNRRGYVRNRFSDTDGLLSIMTAGILPAASQKKEKNHEKNLTKRKCVHGNLRRSNRSL